MTTGDSNFVMPKVSFGHFSIFFQSFTSWNTSFFKIMTSRAPKTLWRRIDSWQQAWARREAVWHSKASLIALIPWFQSVYMYNKVSQFHWDINVPLGYQPAWTHPWHWHRDRGREIWELTSLDVMLWLMTIGLPEFLQDFAFAGLLLQRHGTRRQDTWYRAIALRGGQR